MEMEYVHTPHTYNNLLTWKPIIAEFLRLTKHFPGEEKLERSCPLGLSRGLQTR